NRRDRDAALFGDNAHGFGKLATFDAHDEIKNTAAGAAAEALVESLGLRNAERRRLLGMKRAAGHVVCATLLERHVIGDDANDVGLIFYVVCKPARQSHCYFQFDYGCEGTVPTFELENS